MDQQSPTHDLLIGHLGVGTAVTLTASGVGAVVCAAVAGRPAAAGFVLGAAVALVFFTMSSLLVGWAELVNRELIMPVGLGAYLGKVAVFGLVLFGIEQSNWAGFGGVPWGIVVGAVAWLSAQVGWVLTRR